LTALGDILVFGKPSLFAILLNDVAYLSVSIYKGK